MCLQIDIRIQVTCIILITIMQFQSWHVPSAAVNLNPVCNTTDCQYLGKQLLASINKYGLPCHDFYDYVCHGWLNQHPMPPSSDIWTDLHVTAQDELQQLKKLLEMTNSSSTDNQNARALYKACMKLPFLDKMQPYMLRNVTRKVGNWPILYAKNKEITVPWSAIDDEYIKQTAESALFDLNLMLIDGTSSKQIVTMLKPLASPYGSLIRFQGWGKRSTHKIHYKNALYKIIEKLEPLNIAFVRNTIDTDLNDVLNFRDDLREIIKHLAVDNYETLSIKDFQEWYNNQTQKGDTGKIDWSEKIRALYENFVNSEFSNIMDKTTMIVHKKYFSKLGSLLKKTSKRVIANHIHLYFAERHLEFSTEIKDDIEQSFRNDVYVKAAVRYDLPRWQWCIQQHSMQTVLRLMYTAVAFTPMMKAETEKLAVETKNLIARQIYKSTWLDDEMAEKSIAKITNMTITVGYPAWIAADAYEEYDEHILDPLTPDAYYLPEENHLCVSAACLQTPLYSLNVPYAIKYGAIIALLGHEMYHAFNRNSLKLDCFGKKWWSKPMRKKFGEQSKCFQDYYIKERKLLLHKYKLNWVVALDSSYEDIADVMGLKAAYEGYKQTMEISNGVCSTLPGLEGMSCNQLFFISFAHTLCTGFTYLGFARQLLFDVHSSPEVRVNGVASHMEEFGKAFGCKPTDPLMRVKKRCDIWKT